MNLLSFKSAKGIFLSIVCVTAAGFLNFAGSIVADKLIVPLYLDSITTIAVTACFGLIPGVCCALLSNLLLTINYNSSFLFAVCHVFTALISWLVFEFYGKHDSEQKYILDAFLWAGLLSALINGVLGNYIATRLLASITTRPQIDMVAQGIFVVLKNLNLATYTAGFIENLSDKMVSCIFSFVLYKVFRMVLNIMERH